MIQGNFCPNCGQEISNGQVFCGGCGFKLNPPVQVSDNKNISPAPKNNSLLIVLIVCISLLLFSGIAFGLISILNHNNNIRDNYFEEENDVSYYNDIDDEDGYLFPSDSRFITTQYLNNLEKDEIALIRNEIYARHGYIFTNSYYRDYFSSKSWYKPNKNFSENMLSDIELINKTTIVEYEKARGWR